MHLTYIKELNDDMLVKRPVASMVILDVDRGVSSVAGTITLVEIVNERHDVSDEIIYFLN